MSKPTVGNFITRIEQGERVVYRITEVDEATRTVKMEPILVAGYLAIGLPVKARVDCQLSGAQ